MKKPKKPQSFTECSLSVMNRMVLCSMLIIGGSIAYSQTSDKPTEPPMSPETVLASYKGVTIEAGMVTMGFEKALYEIEHESKDDQLMYKTDIIKQMILRRFCGTMALEEYAQQDPKFIQSKTMQMEGILRRYYFTKHRNEFWPPSEEEMHEYYAANPEKFTTPESFSFRHIFFKTIDEPEQMQRDARKRAEEALQRIKDGDDFVAVAEAYSDSDKKGETVGPFLLGKIKPVLEKAALALKVGETSDIIETEYGFEIIKLESHSEEKMTPYENAIATIHRGLESSAFEKFRVKVVDAHYDEAVSDLNLDVLRGAEEDGEFSDAELQQEFAKVYGDPIYVWRYANFLKGAQADRMRQAIEEKGLDWFVKEQILGPALIAAIVRKEGDENATFVRHNFDQWLYPILYDLFLRNEFEKRITANPITDQETKDYYDKNINNFLYPLEYEAYVITREIPEYNPDDKYETWKAQAEANTDLLEALDRINQGESFIAVAKDYMKDDSQFPDGYMGRIAQGPTSGLIYEAFNLFEGQCTSKPEKIDNTMALLYIDHRYPRKVMPFEEGDCERRARNGALGARRGAFESGLMTEFVDSNQIEFNNDAIEKLSPSNMASYFPNSN